MSTPRSTYPLPNEIFDDLIGMSDSDRQDLSGMWSMLSDDVQAGTDNGRERVRARILSEVAATNSRPAVMRKLSAPIARIYTMRLRIVSAAAVFVVGLSMLLSPSSTQYRAEVGATGPMLVSLSDGSSVSLSPGSRLSVPESFGTSDRTVRLHGQAFFDVSAGATPFEVATFDAKTVVLGTSFAVSAWPGSSEASTEVIVKTGRVSVQASSESVLLNPGEVSSIDVSSHSPVAPSSINVETSLAWMSGGFYFDQELVENVLDEVERRFDVRIDAPTSIKLRRFSYSKQNAEDAGEVLGDLAATIGVRYRPNANGFELYFQ